MSGSTSNIDLISSSQAGKEVTANDAFNAASPTMFGARRASTSAALTWGYYGGAFNANGTISQIANGTLALTASTTCYVEATPAGVVQFNTAGFTAGNIPLYSVVTGTATVASWTDYRHPHTPLAVAIHAATSKATPVDNDEIPIDDSAASFAVKKLTWANLKATVKAYFDTLYLGISASAATANNLSGGAANYVPYQTAANTTAFTGAGTNGQVLTANISGVPTWATSSATLATNLAGGLANKIPYQTAVDTTSFIAAGTVGQILTAGAGGVPAWSSTVKATTIAGGSANQIPYQTAADTTAFITAGTIGQVLTAGTGGLPGWATLSATLATNIANGIANNIPYQTAANTTAFIGVGAAGQILTAGTAGLPGWATPGRPVLSAARTYYVATTGSDSNDGMSSGTSFLTVQKAIDTVCSLDLSIYQATIQIADGTYTGANTLKPYVGSLPPVIQGNATTPTNVIISTTSATCFNATASGQWTLQNFRLQTTTGGMAISASGGSSIINFSGIDFGQCVGNHVQAMNGASVSASGNYTISGGSSTGAHWYAIGHGAIQASSKTITISGTPAFSAAFAWCDRGLGYFSVFGNTFTGSATGLRYVINGNGVCFTNGAGATYLPGGTAGTTATGGQYT